LGEALFKGGIDLGAVAANAPLQLHEAREAAAQATPALYRDLGRRPPYLVRAAGATVIGRNVRRSRHG
jgi:hypothetical protein